MAYSKPLFGIPALNRAGRIIAAASEMDDVQAEKDIVDNWRAAHQYPLNSFTMTLKGRANSVSAKSLVAQRIKRISSVKAKLSDNGGMKLSQMQDVGGCRAVVPTMEDVRDLVGMYFTRPVTHPYMGLKDYIHCPKDTGYRSVHLKFRYAGRGQNVAWEGLKIEIQIRSLLQHKWATSVEAAGTFTDAALKANRGRTEWLRFFALMSSVFALREGEARVPGTPASVGELTAEIRHLDSTHHILDTFARYSALIPHIERSSKATYYLVTLSPMDQQVRIEGFRKEESAEANRRYVAAERALAKDSANQVVLVSVSSITALKRAYPNYFLDTQDFLREVRMLLA